MLEDTLQHVLLRRHASASAWRFRVPEQLTSRTLIRDTWVKVVLVKTALVEVVLVETALFGPMSRKSPLFGAMSRKAALVGTAQLGDPRFLGRRLATAQFARPWMWLRWRRCVLISQE